MQKLFKSSFSWGKYHPWTAAKVSSSLDYLLYKCLEFSVTSCRDCSNMHISLLRKGWLLLNQWSLLSEFICALLNCAPNRVTFSDWELLFVELLLCRKNYFRCTVCIGIWITVSKEGLEKEKYWKPFFSDFMLRKNVFQQLVSSNREMFFFAVWDYLGVEEKSNEGYFLCSWQTVNLGVTVLPEFLHWPQGTSRHICPNKYTSDTKSSQQGKKEDTCCQVPILCSRVFKFLSSYQGMGPGASLDLKSGKLGTFWNLPTLEK